MVRSSASFFSTSATLHLNPRRELWPADRQSRSMAPISTASARSTDPVPPEADASPAKGDVPTDLTSQLWRRKSASSSSSEIRACAAGLS